MADAGVAEKEREAASLTLSTGADKEGAVANEVDAPKDAPTEEDDAWGAYCVGLAQNFCTCLG